MNRIDPSGMDDCLPQNDDCDSGGGIPSQYDSVVVTADPFPDITIGLLNPDDLGLGVGGGPRWVQKAYDLGGKHQPAPAPGYEECKKALATAKKSFDSVAAAESSAALIKEIASATGIDPNVLAAIGVRESGWENKPESGGGGGQGYLQLDKSQWGASIASWAYIPRYNLAAGAGLLQ